jgi:hypothetical protein
MYRTAPSISERNGYVRLGGTPASGDGFIDIKMFVEHEPGTPHVIFGANFSNDIAHRDFTCNALYYDPVNHAIIDPSGRGIADTQNRILRLVCDSTRRSPFHLAQVLVRFFKFLTRGFLPAPETEQAIRSHFLPCLAAMDKATRAMYFRAQVLSKTRKEDHGNAVTEYRAQMVAFGAEAEWSQFIEPVAMELLV